MSLEATVAGRWPYILVCLYLPALVILLLPRSGRPEEPGVPAAALAA